MTNPLRLLLALAALLAVCWALAPAPFTGADEAGHFAYVQQLAETGHAPQAATGSRTLSTELATALSVLNLEASAGNINAQPSFSPIDRDAFARFEDLVTHEQRADGDGPNSFAKNGPLYYLLMVVPYRLAPGGDLLDRLFWVRLAGGAMFVLTVWLTWLLAAELFTRTVVPRLLAAGAVALHPKLTALAGNVNPDILLVLLWTAFALVAVRTVRHGATVSRALTLGLLAGGSALTHGRGLALIGPLLIVGLIVLLRERRGALRPAVVAGAAVTACVVAAFAWTAAHSAGGAFGGELTQATGGGNTGGNLRQLLSYVFQFYFGNFSFLTPPPGTGYGWRQGYIETYFSSLGSLEIVYQPQLIDYLQIVVGAGLIVLAAQVARHWEALRARGREIAVLGAMCVSQIGLLHLASFRDLVGTNGVGVLWTGRYLLPLVAVAAVAVAFVCTRMPRRFAPVAAGAVMALAIALQGSSLAMTFARYYG